MRLAGISDLIATEGKYHPNCYKKFQRKATKAKEGAGKNDLAMEWLISEIRVCAKKGNVLQLSEVFNRYCELAEKANIEVPASFRGRRTTFKEKLELYAEESYDFITAPNKNFLFPRNLHMCHLQILEKTLVQSLPISLLMKDFWKWYM